MIVLKSELHILSAHLPSLDCCSVRALVWVFFCFIMPAKFLWAIYCVGKGGREAKFLLGKVDPITTQILIDAAALAYVQFKFWWFLFQCLSSTDVTRRKVKTWVHFFLFFPLLE